MTMLVAMTADRETLYTFDHDDPEAFEALTDLRRSEPGLVVAYHHERLVVGMVDVTERYFAGGLDDFPGAAS